MHDHQRLDSWLAEHSTLTTALQHVLTEFSASRFHGKAYDAAALHLDEALRHVPEAAHQLNRARAVAVGSLVKDRAPALGAQRVPESVRPWIVRELQKITDFVVDKAEQEYRDGQSDAFVKDVRFTLGLAIPCGAQSVEVDDAVRLRSLVKHAVQCRDARPLAALAASAIRSRWFGIHTDSRDLSEFNEPGWTACYRRIAELLADRPQIGGVVGTSWFFDPQLKTVSPRLAYLQELPLANGAVAIRNGPGAIHTERATATSKARRELYEKGEYVPVCYTIAWPRAAVMRWAGIA